MAVERVEKNGFAVERRGAATSTYFVYVGHMKHVELMPAHGMLHILVTRLDEPEHVDELVDAVWDLAVPGVVDNIEVSYREGDPNETMTVRSR